VGNFSGSSQESLIIGTLAKTSAAVDRMVARYGPEKYQPTKHTPTKAVIKVSNHPHPKVFAFNMQMVTRMLPTV
jgi:hypothetical protein